MPPEWSAMEGRTGRWSKTSPRTSGPDIKPANVRIGKSYPAQKERKKAVKKRQKGPTGKKWEMKVERPNCAYRHANPIIIAVSHETIFEM